MEQEGKMFAAFGVKANLDMLIAGLQEIRHSVGSVRFEDLKVRKDRDEWVVEFAFEPDAQPIDRLRQTIGRVDLADLTEYRYARTLTDETGAEFIRLLPGTFDRILAELRSHRDLESGVQAAISTIEEAL